MRVLVDAQIPKRLAQFLYTLEIDAKHTLELPKQNATPDQEIIKIADQEDRIVISKDSDFLDNYILEGKPEKLLIVSTGNINNDDLIGIFEQNIDMLKSLSKKILLLKLMRKKFKFTIKPTS